MDIGDKILDIFSALIETIWDWIIEPFLGLSSLQQLIFGKNDDGKLVWDTFTKDDLSTALAPMYNSILAVTLVFFVALIAVQGVRFAKNASNPQARSELIQTGLTILFVGLILRFLPGIYDILFAINGAFVDFFSSVYDSANDEIIPKEIESVSEQAIGRILIELVMIGLAIWANFFYMMRKITLIILLTLGPIFIVCMVHPKWKAVTSNWFRELMSTIFVQSVHALTFWFLAMISVASTNVIGTVIAYIVFIPVTVAVRNLFFLGGSMNDNISKAGAAFGLTALGGVIGAVKGAVGDKSLGEIASGAMSAARGTYQNAKGGVNAADVPPNGDVKDTIAGNAASDTGSKKDAERMLKNGEILDRIGKGTMGAMGAIAGAGLGPQGSAILAAAGYSVGGPIGGVTGRSATALGQSLKGKYDKANALVGSNMTEEDLQNADLDTVADAIATKEASEWSKQHADKLKEGYQNRFPDASEQEINQLVANEQARKKSQFKERAGQQIQQAQEYGNDHLDSEGLANDTTTAMVKQWANDNRSRFNEQYALENPQKPDETDQEFQARQDQAFGMKQASMQREFSRIAEIAVKDSINELGHVNKESYAAKLSNGLEGVTGIENPDALAMTGADSGQSVSIFNGSGRLTKDRVINALASSETLKDKEAFVTAQVARGVDRADAIQDWNQNFADTSYADNQKKFGAVGDSIGEGLQLNEAAFDRAQSKVPMVLRKVSAMGNVMTMDAVESVGKHATALKEGFGSANEAIIQSAKEGNGVLSTAKNSVTSGFKGMQSSYAQQGIEAAGSAVEAQANFQDSMGYVGGVLLGAKGYVGARKLGMKVSPYKNEVDNEIYSPSEVAQMAQTTVDDKGNVQIANGAIRQVVTADSSYIEVLTRTGERKRVSRVTSGDSGLAKDAVVYQDLDVQDNMLVPVQHGGKGGSSTYHVDMGGARVPSDLQIIQNPNTLLKQGNIQTTKIPSSIATNPLSVASDESYTPNEVQQLALTKQNENGHPQVVRGAIRQVVTADSSYIEVLSHDGKKHIASPIGKGNASLSNGEVLYQDIDVQDGQYVPLVANVGGNKTTTYSVDSGGNKVATQHKIMQNPNDLATNTRVQAQPTMAFPKGKDYPTFSQFVDQNQFYTDDLQSQGFQNVNVVVENERRFVTAEKEGIRYRVSPVYAGDTRMSSNEVKEIPMTIEQGKLIPQQSNGENSSQAIVYVKSEQNDVTVSNEAHYSTKATDNLIVSRSLLNATRSAQSRQLLEEARQPQGLLD